MKTTLLLLLHILMIPFYLSGQNQPPVAVDDTLDIYWFDDVFTVNVLKNDFDPDGDPIKVFSAPSSVSHTDSTISYTFPYHYFHSKSGISGSKAYMILDTVSGQAAQAQVRLRFHNPWYGYLDINNVMARINNTGDFFWDLDGQSTYLVPKNGNIGSIFNSVLWLGGTDINGQLHMAGNRYNSNGEDYWAGPVMDSIYYSNHHVDTAWNKIWKISRAEIEYHKANYAVPGYVPVKSIATWPGNGNMAMGMQAQLAPYHDKNGDGIYNPSQGDYPYIRGDQTVFFIMNDDKRLHTETGALGFGVEIHCWAYAFDCPLDSALNTTTFLHFDIYNRSTFKYQGCFLGLFSDIDLGNPFDDFIASDVLNNSMIVYNDTGTTGTGGYYPYYPAQSVTFLAGPYLDPDGIDNPKTDTLGNPLCNLSLVGSGFGDDIADNERYGMMMGRYVRNDQSPLGDPGTAAQYYNVIRGIWLDGTNMYYGGNGHLNYGATGPECFYMFPDTTDPCDFGTNLIHPQGFMTGAGGTGPVWDEISAGNASADKRSVTSAGPFTLEPNGKQEFDVAFAWARDYSSKIPWSSVTLLKKYIESIREYYADDRTPCGGSFTAVPEPVKRDNPLMIYPNPARDMLYLNFTFSGTLPKYQIYNISGKKCTEGAVRGDPSQIPVSMLPAGFYILRLITPGKIFTAKFVKL